MFKTIFNLVMFIIIVIVVVIFSGGNFDTLKHNGTKVVTKTIEVYDNVKDSVE